MARFQFGSDHLPLPSMISRRARFSTRRCSAAPSRFLVSGPTENGQLQKSFLPVPLAFLLFFLGRGMRSVSSGNPCLVVWIGGLGAFFPHLLKLMGKVQVQTENESWDPLRKPPVGWFFSWSFHFSLPTEHQKVIGLGFGFEPVVHVGRWGAPPFHHQTISKVR